MFGSAWLKMYIYYILVVLHLFILEQGKQGRAAIYKVGFCSREGSRYGRSVEGHQQGQTALDCKVGFKGSFYYPIGV